MTSNQLAYWNLQETKRSNLINEGIKRDTVSEQIRSNKAKEKLQGRDLTRREVETVLGGISSIAKFFL